MGCAAMIPDEVRDERHGLRPRTRSDHARYPELERPFRHVACGEEHPDVLGGARQRHRHGEGSVHAEAKGEPQVSDFHPRSAASIRMSSRLGQGEVKVPGRDARRPTSLRFGTQYAPATRRTAWTTRWRRGGKSGRQRAEPRSKGGDASTFTFSTCRRDREGRRPSSARAARPRASSTYASDADTRSGAGIPSGEGHLPLRTRRGRRRSRSVAGSPTRRGGHVRGGAGDESIVRARRISSARLRRAQCRSLQVGTAFLVAREGRALDQSEPRSISATDSLSTLSRTTPGVPAARPALHTLLPIWQRPPGVERRVLHGRV